MSSYRVVAAILACGLTLTACSNSTSKPAEKPAERTAAQPAPEPEFYLPAESELTTTASGLKYRVLREGSGTPPTLDSTFTAHYCGWLTDGTKFDGSYGSEPLTYPVHRMIKGWQEALVMMKPGAEYILVVPASIAYGDAGMPPVIPPNATLVFRMELLSTSG